MNPRRMRCKKCGHTWTYTGSKDPEKPYQYIQCPDCRSTKTEEIDSSGIDE